MREGRSASLFSTPASPGWVGPIGATFVGILAVVAAAIPYPQGDESNRPMLMSGGVLALAIGAATWPGTAPGTRGRRILAIIGITLGALTFVSTGFTLLNTSFSTNLPTLQTATRAVWPAPQVDAPAPPIDGAPTTTDPNLSEPISILTVADERAYLVDVVTRASELINEVGVETIPLQFSADSYPFLSNDGGVVIGNVLYFEVSYVALPEGGYTLSLRGTTFGTIVQFDTRSSVVLVQ